MNKAELIDAITERLGDKKAAQSAVEAVVDTIQRAVAKGERVAITGFGVFEKQVRAARTARNPATGATIKLKKTAVPKFRPGTNFKDVVSGAKKMTAPAKSTATKATTATSKTTATRAAKAAPAKTSTKASATKASATKASSSRSTAAKSTGTKAAASKATAGRGSAAKSTSTRSTAAKKSTARKRSV